MIATGPIEEIRSDYRTLAHARLLHHIRRTRWHQFRHGEWCPLSAARLAARSLVRMAPHVMCTAETAVIRIP